LLTSNMTCVTRFLAAQKRSDIAITSAVGRGTPPRCRNLPEDVRTIQAALNRFTPLEGGPAPLLVVDGICGPKTRAAIDHFQKKWALKPKNWKVPDGIVDPVGPTIDRLRLGSGRVPDLPAEFKARIPRVIGVITAVRAALTLAKTFLSRGDTQSSGPLPSLSLIGQAEARKADRHFHVTKAATPQSRLDEIDNIYFRMLTAIGHVPQGMVLAADEPATLAVGAFMFGGQGGFDRQDPRDTLDGTLPAGSIYLCPKARTLGVEAFTYVIIHELAHFTGPILNGIVDHAYFHRDPKKYAGLTAALAFRNADSYSQFAFEIIGKPDFNVEENRGS
jgi:hypothetical protein